jgi:NDP-sugar pyrophosphorylase family protein
MSAATGAPVAVVMVGGRGERLRPLTDDTPKPLLEVGGRPIVERILAHLAAAGITDAWLTVNYLADQFEERIGDGAGVGLRVRYVREDAPLGTAGALGLLPRADVTGPIVVTNGDLVTDLDFAALLRAHVASGAGITVCGVEHDTQVPYGVLRTGGESGAELLGIDEKPVRTDLVSAGMYVVEPDLLDLVPAGQALGMPDLIEATLAAGRGVGVFRVDAAWYDIGSHDEFHRVSRLLAQTPLEQDHPIESAHELKES